MRRLAYVILAVLALLPAVSGFVGHAIGAGVLHPMRLDLPRSEEIASMLQSTGATKQDFAVSAADGTQLKGWIVRPSSPNGNWVLLFHGLSDNRTGTAAYAEFLLRDG